MDVGVDDGNGCSVGAHIDVHGSGSRGDSEEGSAIHAGILTQTWPSATRIPRAAATARF